MADAAAVAAAAHVLSKAAPFALLHKSLLSAGGVVGWSLGQGVKVHNTGSYYVHARGYAIIVESTVIVSVAGLQSHDKPNRAQIRYLSSHPFERGQGTGRRAQQWQWR